MIRNLKIMFIYFFIFSLFLSPVYPKYFKCNYNFVINKTTCFKVINLLKRNNIKYLLVKDKDPKTNLKIIKFKNYSLIFQKDILKAIIINFKQTELEKLKSDMDNYYKKIGEVKFSDYSVLTYNIDKNIFSIIENYNNPENHNLFLKYIDKNFYINMINYLEEKLQKLMLSSF